MILFHISQITTALIMLEPYPGKKSQLQGLVLVLTVGQMTGHGELALRRIRIGAVGESRLTAARFQPRHRV